MEFAPVRVPSPAWAKGQAWIEDGEIVLDEKRARPYGFEDRDSSQRMAFDLAVLSKHPGDVQEVKSFVRRYGLLWHSWDDLRHGECRESLQDWWTEAGRLYFVGAFYDALTKSKRERSATPVQNFLRQFGYGFPTLPPTHKDFDTLYMIGASKMIEDIINDGLNAGPNRDPQSRQGKRRTWWGLKVVGPGDFVLLQYPPDLVSRAYSAFAWLIANDVETRICEVCYKLFSPTPRQKSDVCSETCRNTLKSRKRRAKP
jgi:hypothetical protein